MKKINKRLGLISGGFLLMVVSYLFAFKKPIAEPIHPKHPNLLIIIADQWRGQALGFEKKEPVETPVLDVLASSSFVMQQMVSNYPLCSPARAMLLTGMYPLKNHVYSNANSASAPDGVELSASSICWSDVLKANGYCNGYIGKWHLDSPHEPYVPTSNNVGDIAWNEWTSPARRHGFDYWYAYGTYDVHNKPMYWDTKASRDSFHYVAEWGPQHEADKAIAFLKNTEKIRDSHKPFSLVVSMNPPHTDYETVPNKYQQPYENIPLDSFLKDPNIPPANTAMGKEYRNNIRYYYANITGVDEQIGRILTALKETHLDNNTLLIFMSDHGNCLGKHQEITKNNIYEESVRIPMIVSWKGHIKARLDNVFLGSLPDLYPTILDLMGFKTAIPTNIDGRSYASYFKNGEGERPSEQYIMGAILDKPEKLYTGFRSIRTAEYKLAYVNSKGKKLPYFYDLTVDPFEMKNIYTTQDSRVIKMKNQLLSWLKKTKDPFDIEN